MLLIHILQNILKIDLILYYGKDSDCRSSLLGVGYIKIFFILVKLLPIWIWNNTRVDGWYANEIWYLISNSDIQFTIYGSWLNTLQYNAIQYGLIWYDTVQCDAMR